MGHLEGNFTPVLYIGRKVPKGKLWMLCVALYLVRVSSSVILKAGYFRFVVVLLCFLWVFIKFSQDYPKTCVDSAPCCVLSTGVPVCDY